MSFTFVAPSSFKSASQSLEHPKSDNNSRMSATEISHRHSSPLGSCWDRCNCRRRSWHLGRSSQHRCRCNHCMCFHLHHKCRRRPAEDTSRRPRRLSIVVASRAVQHPKQLVNSQDPSSSVYSDRSCTPCRRCILCSRNRMTHRPEWPLIVIASLRVGAAKPTFPHRAGLGAA